MKSKLFNWSLLLLIPTFLMGQASNLGIIPQPNQIESEVGSYSFGESVQISGNHQDLDALVEYASGILSKENNWNSEKGQNHRKSDLRLELNKKEDPTEGAYRLEVNKKGILISAVNEQGIFYGLQTLRQLVSQQQGKMELPHLSIKDAPRFGWRAYMLDEGRYFQGMDQVKKLLDEMARLKMNVFHWHLVDDQGWRIEIKKYPLLTEIGSKRKSTQVGPRKWDSPIQSGEPHEGYYTQEEIKEIIAYAEERYITIVPEIEMPGHSSAAIAAYPWLGSSGKQIEVPINFGVSEDIFNVADPKVYDFLTDVLDEVMALFPSKVIHIGGDEAKYDHWENSEEIRAYMKKHNLPTFADLQVDFTNRISNYIESKGRKMMGWNEILGKNVHEYQAEKDGEAETELSKNAVIHFWRGDIKLMTEAAEAGYTIVNSLHTETYLDYSYSSIPLKRAYDFNPVPKDLDSKYHKRIIGTGTQMWGEWIPTSGYMDFMTFPRIAAYAEVGWTQPQQKDFDRFLEVLPNLMEIWKAKDIYYAPLEEAMPK